MIQTATAGEDETSHDYRLVLLAAVVWAVLWLVTGGGPAWLLAAGGVVLGFGVVALARPGKFTCALCALALLAGLIGWWRVHALQASALAAAAADYLDVDVEFELQTDPKVGRYLVTAPATVYQARTTAGSWAGALPVRVQADEPRIAAYPVGTRLAAKGRLTPAGPAEPFAAVLHLAGPVAERAPPVWGLRLVDRVREGLHEACAELSPRQRALVPALVLGDTTNFTPQLKRDLQTTGLLHLAAASGANLSIMIAFVLVTARWFRVRGIGLQVLALLAVVVFVALCRTEPSVFRAAAMGTITIIAVSTVGAARPTDRRRGMQYLALACLALLTVDPWMARSAGFSLSVSAAAGILIWARIWAQAMDWLPTSELITVPLAAQLSTQPIITAISGQISYVGVATNVLAGLIVGPTTVVGFAAAGATLFSPALARLLAQVAGWGVELIASICEVAASLPFASGPWPTSPIGLLTLLGLVILAIAVMPRVLAKRWLVVLGTAVVAGGILTASWASG